VVLLQVSMAPLALEPAGRRSPAVTAQAIEGAIAQAKGYLERVAQSNELAGVTTSTEVLLGETEQQILSVASSQSVDLMIITSRGSTGLARWALGSTAYRLVHHSHVPLLVLREGHLVAALSQVSATRPISAVVALDGSPFAESVLLPAAHLVSALSAPHRGVLHLTEVVQPSSAMVGREGGSPHDDEARERAKVYLATVEGRLLEALKEPRPLITRSVMLDKDIASALISMAEQGERGDGEGFSSSDLIALSTHGRAGVRALIMGSVTNRVLNTTKLPLLIIRPKQVETGLE
jgi:nucleotide-binding universal stress UspA family protein